MLQDIRLRFLLLLPIWIVLAQPMTIRVRAYEPLVYEPAAHEDEGGRKRPRHIVLLAGDHEYRSEETLPALARILARHHGFRCTVLFTVDRTDGTIAPGSNYMPGLEALQTADLMVIFLRFQDFPPEQMGHIDAYLKRGGPVLGLRTSTHAFKIPKESPYARFSFRHSGPDWKGGFGRYVLGETWAGHYGRNHVMSTRLDLVAEAASHPVLRGVERPWVQSGGYWTDPAKGSRVLALAQPLSGMSPDDPPAADKKPCPGVWVREYSGEGDRRGRVFTTTYGASVDLLNEGFRRMLVNGCYWCLGLEDEIRAGSNVSLVGPFHPAKFRFGGHRQGVRPLELSGWESPIMPLDKLIAPPVKRGRKRSK